MDTYRLEPGTGEEPLHDPLAEAAAEHFSIPYLFPYQRLVISNILRAAGAGGFAPKKFINPVTGEEDTLDTTPHQIVILPTGAGKSLCFMLPARMLTGPSLVIFPLLSLMADQERRLREAGMEAAVLRGGQPGAERKALWQRIEKGHVQMVLTNPETALQKETFRHIASAGFSHLVIDETHTVSEWGEQFRPVYLEIGRIVKETDIPVVTAFTATASEVIVEKVKKIVFPGLSPNVITANPDRPNISYRVIPSICKEYDLARLLVRRSRPGSVKRPALVFCRSRVGAEMTARYLRRQLQENEIYFYHAGLEKAEKTRIEKWFFSSEDGILAATCAYGMGVDKKNIRSVFHRDLSPSVESYLQESGRGGRDRGPAEGVLIFGEEDRNAAERIDSPIEKARYEALLRFAEDRGKCRRESLLALLGSAPEGCFGCDVCAGTVQKMPAGEEEIIRFLRRYRRGYTRPETVTILSGRMTPEAREKELWLNPQFGALQGWRREEIDAAVDALERKGRIRAAWKLLWGKTLTLGPAK
jgi:ATP-dependent DNA helicase RecQ